LRRLAVGKEQWRLGLGGLAVGLVALVALIASAFHANGVESRLTSAAASSAAARSDRYYACLSAQSHSLLRAGDVVYLAQPTLAEWVTLTKVIGGWAHVTLQRSAATVAVTMEQGSGRGTCQGDVLVTARQVPGGRVEFARAAGPASLR
jgi:hypothetical protein